MLFVAVKEPTEERGTGKSKEEKSYLSTCSTLASTGYMPTNTAQLKQSYPVPTTLTTTLRVCIQSGNGINSLARNGSGCHKANCRETKFENTQPEPFCS